MLTLLVLAGIAALIYFNRAALLVAYYNWLAKRAAERANTAKAAGDQAAQTKALTEQRNAEWKAAEYGK